MSNAPANLGSAYADLGFVYQPGGMAQFIAAAQQAQTVYGRLAAAQQAVSQAQASGNQQAAGAATAVKQAAQNADRLAQAQIRVATAQKDYATAIQIARQQQQLAAGDEVKRLNLLTQEIKLTEQLAREQQKAAKSKLPSGASGAPVLPRTFAGVTSGAVSQAAGALSVGAVIAYTVESVKLKLALDAQKQSFATLIGDVARANKLYDEGQAFGKKYGFTQQEIAKVLQESALLIKNSNAPLEQQLSVLARLASLNPEQGIEGAVVAVKELASGDINSLVERFNIGRGAANKLKDAIAGGADVTKVLDTELARMGVTSKVLENRVQGDQGALNNLKQAQEGFSLAVGNFAKGPGVEIIKFFTASIEGVTKLYDKLKGFSLADFGKELLKAGGNPIKFLDNLIGTGAAINDEAKKELDQFVALSKDKTEVAARTFARIKQLQDEILADQARGDNDAADTKSKLIPVLLEQAKSLDFAAVKADQLQKATDAYLDSEATAAPKIDAATEAQKRQIATSEELAKAQAGLSAEFTKAAEAEETAAKKRDAALDELDKGHKKRSGKLIGDILDAESAGRSSFNSEGKPNERAQLEIDNGEKLSDAKAKIAQRDSRAAEDQALADKRRTRDYNEQALQQLTDYRKRRAEVVADQAKRESEIERDEQRQRAEDQRQANAASLQSLASFTQQLYGLTRGNRGSNKQDRAEARKRLAAAQAEAAELTRQTGDAQAGAALLAAREQQIIQDLQRKKDAAQLRRDARRGGRGRSADAQAEIAEVAGLQDAANAAQIDAIKQGAIDKAKQRDQERQDRLDDNKKQLADLDQSYVDQRAAAKAARDQQLKDEEEDRAIAKKRRDEDDAEQLDTIKEQNKQRLAEFDQHNKDRVQHLKDALEEENDTYDEQHKKILDDYQATIDELKAKIDKAKADLILAPDAKAEKDQADAARRLGKIWGDSYVQAIMDSVKAIDPSLLVRPADGRYQTPTSGTYTSPATVGGGGGGSSGGGSTAAVGARSRGSVVGNAKDAILTDKAIDQIVVGAKQSDGFDSLRGKDLHAGVDLATPDGSPVRSPIDGQIIGIGSTEPGGNYVKVQGANGDVWYFGHLSQAKVGPGQRVRRGDVVALSGHSGSAVTGPHVHVQLQTAAAGGHAVDPTAALERLAGGGSATTTAQSAAPRTKNGDQVGISSYNVPNTNGTPLDRPQLGISPGFNPIFLTPNGTSLAPTPEPPRRYDAPITTQPVTVNAPLNVYIQGNTIGNNVTEAQVKQLFTVAAEDQRRAHEAQQRQELAALRAGGPRGGL